MQQSEINMQDGNCAKNYGCKRLVVAAKEHVIALSLLLMGLHSNDLHSVHEVVIFALQRKLISVGGIFLGW